MGLVSCLATIHSVTFAGLMTLIEVAGLVLIVGAGVWNGTGLLTRLPEIWPGGDLGGWLGVASTTMIAVFAFIGFEHLVNVAEEMKEPRRTLPAALFLTLGLTAVIYGLVVWVSIIAVPPSELAASNAPLAMVFERLTGWPPSSLSVIAIVATLNGVIVHMIMIARVIYGLAQQGNLPRVLGRVSRRTGTPLVATGIGVTLILLFSTALPLEGLAELTSQGTLVLFAIVNLALIRIKWRESTPPPEVFICPMWIPYAGLAASLLLLVFDSLPLS
jgi:amino acid transporter